MSKVRLRLPATSANLGPGFDTLALALQLYLHVEAEAAPPGQTESMRINAAGRSASLCSVLDDNLLVKTYRSVFTRQERSEVPLSLTMRNEIPLGMGCGSSAAVRLAGIALAAHFGQLGWDRDRILLEAARLEGHPDNAAACWRGGFVAAAWTEEGGAQRVIAVTMRPPAEWRAMLVLPEQPLATSVSRAVLPDRYERPDVVQNLQSTALLTAALATGRGDLVAAAMRDRLHQPYRAKECPLLPMLLPLAGNAGILGVALSGAGPGVLLLIESDRFLVEAKKRVLEVVDQLAVEILICPLEGEAAEMVVSQE